MTALRFAFLWLACVLALAAPAAAHEVRPAYLEVTESAPAVFDVTWKQPVLDGRRLKMDPVFPEGCARSGERISSAGSTLIQRWQMACDLSSGEIRIDGLDRTLTDVFVRLNRLNGEQSGVVLRPGSSVLDLTVPSGAPTATYFIIGVEHILFGWDHLLFVLGMVLLVRPKQLLLTLTAFTVAHSITLAAASLGGITLPGPPVEITIAMSIALLGAEAIHRLQGRMTLSQRIPWAIAFGFGLIHGFGFAGALSEIGLPKGAEVLALLLFNVGVEAGQILFVGAVLAVAWLYFQVASNRMALARGVLAYFIGIMGTFWAIERLAASFL
ncbi:MAG: HupE/UreJ family protein [Hyphomonas sp.]|uniref:HupE/UreJ family protein n=1 Tax=Hyphomonas sp. TaxID=87 RepID=UPI00352849B4